MSHPDDLELESFATLTNRESQEIAAILGDILNEDTADRAQPARRRAAKIESSSSSSSDGSRSSDEQRTRPRGLAGRGPSAWTAATQKWSQITGPLEAVLTTLQSGAVGLELCLVFSGEGAVIAAPPTTDPPEQLTQRLASALYGLGHVAEDLRMGRLDEVILRSQDKSMVIVTRATDEVFVLGAASAEARLGTLLMEITGATTEVRHLIASHDL